MGIALEKELSGAGYKLLGIDKSKDELILSILKTRNNRYLKAIPFLIYNYHLDVMKIYDKTFNKNLFGQIINFTKRIFEENNIKKDLPEFSDKGNLNYEEFKQEFELQTREPKLTINKQKIYAEMDLQMWLSQLFTKKEKQIMKRILEEKPISRTNYEYYSRKTKKKLNSIINLQDFAKTLYARTPKQNKELFELKKSLEDWLKTWEIEEEIKRFHINEDKIVIYTDNTAGKGAMTIFKLQKIKDKKILDLLGKYKEYDFS